MQEIALANKSDRLCRRNFLKAMGSCAALSMVACGEKRGRFADIGEHLEKLVGASQAPGIVACVTNTEDMLWSSSHGFADIANQKPITLDSLQNIASISKTFVTTALMQLWEEDRFDLDDDVGNYFDFPVRNPKFPNSPITITQLLTHTSSIKDGPAYIPSYACGDPSISLQDWLQRYFDPSGEYYDAEENFFAFPPGTTEPPDDVDTYCNLSFGLLGELVQVLGDASLSEHCRQRIFDPLGMSSTGWFLRDIDVSQHVVNYGAQVDPRIPMPPDDPNEALDGKYFGRCLYSFPNYSDGLIRTNVRDLSRYLRAYLGRGSFGSTKILDESTVSRILTADPPGQGLCFYNPWHLNFEPTIWGHGGRDPGTRTMMHFSTAENVGVIVFTNFDGWDVVPDISDRLFRQAGVI